MRFDLGRWVGYLFTTSLNKRITFVSSLKTYVSNSDAANYTNLMGLGLVKKLTVPNKYSPLQSLKPI